MFGRFGNKSKKSSPPVAPPVLPTPGPGTIASFKPSDGVGTIRLASGEELRFGGSACRNGLQAAEGIRVLVGEIEPHPLGGWRAKAVTIDPTAATAALTLLDAQDVALGNKPLGPEEAVATALQLGTMTLLLKKVPGAGRAGLQALFDQAGLAELGFSLDNGPQPTLRCGGGSVMMFAGTQPFPPKGLDLHLARELVGLGDGFLTFQHGLPGNGLNLRLATGSAPDAWASNAPIRLTTRAARRFVERGLVVGVLLHRAGQAVVPAQAWARRVAEVDNDLCRPFGGWLDFGQHDGLLASYGMDVFWMSDVAAPIALPGLDEDESYQRAHEALVTACHRMIHSNKMLGDGEEFAVPIGQEAGGFALVEDNPGVDDEGAPRWRGRLDGSRLLLEPVAAIPTLGSLWANAAAHDGRDMPYPAYRAMLLGALEKNGWVRLERMTFHDVPAAIPVHEVFVYRRPDKQFVTVTCGIGRWRQPRGTPENDDAYIELMAPLPGHSPRVARTLSSLGRLLHARGSKAAPIGPEHRIKFEEPISAQHVPYVVMAWAGAVPCPPGPSISLFAPMIMTEEEKVRVPADELGGWIKENAGTPEAARRWLWSAEGE